MGELLVVAKVRVHVAGEATTGDFCLATHQTRMAVLCTHAIWPDRLPFLGATLPVELYSAVLEIIELMVSLDGRETHSRD